VEKDSGKERTFSFVTHAMWHLERTFSFVTHAMWHLFFNLF